MNQVNLIGRPTTDPEIRYSQGENETAISSFTIAVDNPYSRDDSADFIRIKAFGKTAEFAENYISKGVRIGLTGRIQTGSYEHKDGYTVFTTDVVASNFYFADSPKDSTQHNTQNKKGNQTNSGRGASNKGNANRRQGTK
jgi:single-strand DNA-binding protein